MINYFKNSHLPIAVVGLILSLTLNFYLVSKYDVNHLYKNKLEHKMVKGDPKKYYAMAEVYKLNFSSGINFFDYKHPYAISYLHPIIIGAFYFSIDESLYENKNNKKIISINNNKHLYFFFQSLFYYFSVIFFAKNLANHLHKRDIFFTVVFLSFEPTILFFHSSFWSESIFFSLMLFFLSLLLQNKKTYLVFYFVGFLLGLLYLQRSVSMFMFFFIFIYFIFTLNKNRIKKIFILSCGLLTVLSFLAYNNFQRDGSPYITPQQAKEGFWMYMIPSILAKKEGIDYINAEKIKKKIESKWLAENKINRNNLNKKEQLRFLKFKQLESYKIMLTNPILTINHVTKKTLHFLVLDPLAHVYFFYDYQYKGPSETRYYKNNIHQNLILPRILYTMFIYIISIIGFYNLMKVKKNRKFFILLASLIVYFTIIQGWIGNNRYATINLLFLAIFFSNGIRIFFKQASKIFK